MISIIIITGILNLVFGYVFQKYSKKITEGEFIVVSVVVWILLIIGFVLWYFAVITDRYYVNNQIKNITYIPRYKYHSTCPYPCYCNKKRCKVCLRPCDKIGGDKYKYKLVFHKKSFYVPTLHHDEFNKIKHKFNVKKIKGNRPIGTFSGDMNDYYYTPKTEMIVPFTLKLPFKNKVAVSENFVVNKEFETDKVLNYPNTNNFNIDKVVSERKQDELFIENINIINSKLNDANIVVYIAKDISICDAVKARWKNGKFNDLIFCLGSLNNIVNFIKVFGWTRNEVLKKNLESMILNQNLNKFSEKNFQNLIVDSINKNFILLNMDDYNYLSVKFSFKSKLYFILVFFVIMSGLWLTSYYNKYED